MLSQKLNIHRVFHAIGDPTRRAIVEKLSVKPLLVSRLAKPMDMTLAAVVQHLQVLERCGLVHTEKVGRVRTCRIEPAGFWSLRNGSMSAQRRGNAVLTVLAISSRSLMQIAGEC